MVTATLTTKGQITIPKSVRDSLRLHSGDRVAFVVHGNAEALLKPITKSVDEVFGKLRDPKRGTARSVPEMKAAVGARFRRQLP